MSQDEVVKEVERLGAPWVTVTGGEPLAQRQQCLTLLRSLCDKGFSVSLETSGALTIEGVDERVTVILDLKTPASGEVSRNLYENLGLLKEQDEIKFVVSDRQDYEWAKLKMDEYNLLSRRGKVLFSPTYGNLKPPELADWIVADKLPVRFQLQLHKLLWNDEPGR